MRCFCKITNSGQKLSIIRKYISHMLVILTISVSLGGCASFTDSVNDFLRPERLVPVFDPDAHITPQTGAIIYVKNGIVAIAVPLHDIKNVDGFAIILHNRTNHWVSLIKEDCQMLDQSGEIVKQIDRSQYSFYFKKNFKPKLPPEFAADVFRWDKTIRIQGDPAVLPTEDLKKTNIMPKNTHKFYVYFKKRSNKSKNLRIIVPRITSEFNGDQTTFVFKFRMQRM